MISCAIIPFLSKGTKKKAENNLFQFCFTLRKCFVFVICRHFSTSKWLKVLKLNKICLKMVKCMTPKTTYQNIFFLTERTPFNLQSRFNEYGIKLLILIYHYRCRNLVSTRHLRSWYFKHKMSVDNSSQKIARNVYLQGTVMHQFSIGKCIEKCKMLQK